MNGARLPRGLEVGGGPDGRAPPVGDWRKKKRRGGAVGPAGEGVAGPRGKEGRKPGLACGLREKREEERWVGWARREKGGGLGFRDFLF
jgi:hypothetical protein